MMRKVQRMPWWWFASGCAGLLAISAVAPVPFAAWMAGVGYLVVSSVLLSEGLRRRSAERLGAANAVTATRSVLVGLATALTVASLGDAASPALFVTIVTCALVLDGVDGYVARRTGTESELGARFDMEVDAFLLLVLAIYDVSLVGWWVLAIGLLRYGFVAAGRLLPWMRRTLPPRYWRKVAGVAGGIALTVIATQLLPPAANVVVAVAALLLLLESFGRDVAWLARMNRSSTALVVSPRTSTASHREESWYDNE